MKQLTMLFFIAISPLIEGQNNLWMNLLSKQLNHEYQNQFLLSSNSIYGISLFQHSSTLSFTHKTNLFSVSLSQIGNSKYGESKFNFEFGKSLSPNWKAGISNSFLFINQKEAPSHYKPIQPQLWSFHQITSTTSFYIELNSQKSTIPNSITLIGNYQVSPFFSSGIGFNHFSTNSFLLLNKLSYKNIKIALNLSTGVHPLFLSFNYLHKGIQFFTYQETHLQLGPQLGAGFIFNWQ